MKAKKKRTVRWIMQEIEEKQTKKNRKEGRKGKKEIQENHDTSDPPSDARGIQSTIERTSPPVLGNQHAVKHMLL